MSMTNENEALAAGLARPLQGVRVIEAASYLAGPFAAMMLSDLGAEVIKVEPPGGDPYRNVGVDRDGTGILFINSNRGKKGISVDLKSEDGLAAFKKLLGTADVYIENMRPHVAEKLGLGYEEIEKLNPRLVRITVTGYGPDGDLAREPVYEALIQGRTGLIAYEAAGAAPRAANSFVGDKTSAIFVGQIALAALIARDRSGKGVHVQTSMLDIISYYNFPDVLQHRTFVDDTSDWTSPTQVVVATSDGHIILSPVTGKQLGATLKAVGHPEWKDDFLGMTDKAEMSRAFFRRVAEPIGKKTSTEWLDIFREYGVPSGPVNDPNEHLDDPQVIHNQLYTEFDTPLGRTRAIRYPATFDGRRFTAQKPAPSLGEDNEELL
jgi:crotonobetainyl-CoA:carnitine CoA-transferase CaiB-like acyl-CoA transferase